MLDAFGGTLYLCRTLQGHILHEWFKKLVKPLLKHGLAIQLTTLSYSRQVVGKAVLVSLCHALCRVAVKKFTFRSPLYDR